MCVSGSREGAGGWAGGRGVAALICARRVGGGRNEAVIQGY